VKRTDYGRVAERYDENQDRHKIPPDELLARLLEGRSGSPLSALDLACGTGNYLRVQRDAYGEAVRWRGIDASEAMLGRARTKVGDIELLIGRAESLPYEDASFDYVVTSYAFHHFEDKPRALDEIRRVSKPGAAFRAFNVDPTRMPGWWVYRFFPEAWLEDQKRFWSPELLCHELEARGYDASAHVDFTLAFVPVVDVWADAERREISQLAILTDAQYERGLARVRHELDRAPGGRVPSEIALISCTAHCGMCVT
jgi:ubiquinone/menaquinone biosynthesis C-methylase UbiE